MSDDLRNVPGFAPAALVVEFNLYEWRETRHIKRGFTLFDQYDDETDAEYHERLSSECEPVIRWGRQSAAWDYIARQWSDHYAKRGAV